MGGFPEPMAKRMAGAYSLTYTLVQTDDPTGQL
jgi:hypothetical protein